MLNRLWFRLTAAFALIIFIGMTVTVWLSSSAAAAQFEHFMVGAQMVRPAAMQDALIRYYAHRQSWEDLDIALPQLVREASDGPMIGMFGLMMGIPSNRIQIVDRGGRVLADSAGELGGPPLNEPPLQRWPLVYNGVEVGALVVEGALMGALSGEPQVLIEMITRTVFIAALIAAATALGLAALLMRQITLPLSRLMRAAQRIAAGDLSVRTPASSNDEIGELTRVFNQMAASLEAQETLRRNLMADIAHELRTPLAGIQGAIEAMLDGIFPADTQNLAALHAEALLLGRLIDDLRTLANAEAGQLHLELSRVDLAEVSRTQVNAFQLRARERHISLRAETPPQPVWIEADALRIEQVLHNLLDNALRHTPEHGTVVVRLCVSQEHVILTVTDNGSGISAEDLPRVFDRFYRGDPSRQRATGGAGLGLAIARKLVEAHGGSIWVDSPAPGSDRGAEFGIRLPRRPIRSEALQRRPHAHPEENASPEQRPDQGSGR
ncbi:MULTISPECIES: sensor histidine kinase [Caldilinea]|jgi:signal transduction histidine kinase|uniref:histidine kinase n=1 Tax=Caldilinea aerophila (strain DSM 14535 / JCM 11387 / NBRC 104270 / STL-6-O1) TaxID=926550 RepID=I0I2J3_CALAS|nr:MULTISPECIES: ATP-binding protein [Caldilinea]BAL99480.1 putative two-component histidine kinase [Caldilinea aerophila DSM 14535 = NBRC 104270]GIV73924.1 MAG: two-component sensor histidine kinase [Caldilinea sp.]